MPFSSRFLPAGSCAPALAWAAGAALSFALFSPSAWAAREASAQPCLPGAYQGYSQEDPRASGVTDIVWHRRVRAVNSSADGQPCQRYVLRAAPRLGPFDAVHTTHLGDVTGFIALQGDQGRVLTELGQDVLGEPYGGDWTFLGHQPDAKGQSMALFSYRLSGTPARRYVQLRHGKLLARSPNSYSEAGSNGDSLPQPPSAGPRLLRVALDQDRWGLLDLRSLRELVPPRYQKAGVLTAEDDQPWLLFGENNAHPGGMGPQVHFFRPDGTALNLPDVGQFLQVSAPSGQVEHLVLTSRDGSRCRYLNASLQALLPQAVPKLPADACPQLRPDEPLRFTGADGLVYRYRYSPDKGLQSLGLPLVGSLRAGFGQRLLLQLHAASAPAASAPAPAASEPAPATPTVRYKVYSDAGQPLLDGQSFEGFEDLGCGHWRLLRHGEWLQLTPEGKLGPQTGAPGRC